MGSAKDSGALVRTRLERTQDSMDKPLQRQPGARAAILNEEVARARVFFRIIAVLTALVAVVLPWLPGPSWLRAATAGILAAVLCISLSVAVLLRDPRRFSSTLMAVVGSVFALLGVTVIYYLGLFSAAAAFLCVGIYFFGLGSRKRAAWATYLVCAVSYLAFSLAVAKDWVPDLSLFSVAHVSERSRLYRVVMMQVVFALTFYLARSSRRATDQAMRDVARAGKKLRERDAILAETQRQLERVAGAADGPLSGQRLGKYRLGQLLGRGGMGDVYAAHNPDDGQQYAIKLLHPNMAYDEVVVRRFFQEAQIAASVPSQHVAQVFEVGRTPNDLPYLVMEYLEGHDLSWYLRRYPTLDLATVVMMVEQTAGALAAVRDAGVVHRDLKPANLFLVDAIPHTWKVLDFGLSKVHGGEALTQQSAIGTPEYMAPEQARGLPVDHRADVYALGAIAYRALTGQPPFTGSDITTVLLDVLYTQPSAPSSFSPLSLDVDLVLAIAMAKNPDNRFARVEDFAAALARSARGQVDDGTRGHAWGLLRDHPWGVQKRPQARG